jgi:hypothetical protein
MFRERTLRLIAVNAMLIASTIQGLTPDTDSVVSPFALQWLQRYAGPGHRDAAHGRRPDAERSAPSNDADQDEAPVEVVLPVVPGPRALLSRRSADAHSRHFTSTRLGNSTARLDSLLEGLSPRPTATVTDPISALCRMIC